MGSNLGILIRTFTRRNRFWMKGVMVVGYIMIMLAAMPAKAQELNAKITINRSQIQGTDASVFDVLQKQL